MLLRLQPQHRDLSRFSAIAAPSQDREAFPSCKIVIARFERLEGHQQAGPTN